VNIQAATDAKYTKQQWPSNIPYQRLKYSSVPQGQCVRARNCAGMGFMQLAATGFATACICAISDSESGVKKARRRETSLKCSPRRNRKYALSTEPFASGQPTTPTSLSFPTPRRRHQARVPSDQKQRVGGRGFLE
jgi:hypothetical protein